VSPGRQGPSSEGTVVSDEVAVALLCEIAPVVVGLVDTDETIVDLGGALLPRLGYQREAWVGRRLPEMLDDPTVLALVRDGLAGRPAAGTTLLDGRTWLVSVRPELGGAGEVTGAAVVLTYDDQGDVHRELTAREAWNEQFAALIELSTDFIAIADLDGTVTYVNRAGRQLVGLAADEEALGRPTDDYFTDLGRALSREIEDSVRLTGSWQGESELRHFRTGESIPVSVDSFLVTRSSDGRPLALATVQRDLRARLRAEDALAVRVAEQRAIAELGRLALALPLEELMGEAVKLLAARYPDLDCGVLQRRADGRHS
jgi:PAS domain S-box-containing protein